MSWREVARRAVEEEALDVAPAADAADNYEAEERAAIASIEGGLPVEWAVGLTALERGPRPHGITERDWRKALDGMWRRAETHGGAFAAHGWTFSEVFAIGDSWLRLDQRGCAWDMLDAEIEEITEESAVFRLSRGDRLTHRRPH